MLVPGGHIAAPGKFEVKRLGASEHKKTIRWFPSAAIQPQTSRVLLYHYQPGLQRYRCKEQGCKRTFNDLTGTLLDGSKRSLAHWILATFLLCLACSSRRIARELGVHGRTSYRWCWWLRNAALSYEMHRQLEGT